MTLFFKDFVSYNILYHVYLCIFMKIDFSLYSQYWYTWFIMWYTNTQYDIRFLFKYWYAWYIMWYTNIQYDISLLFKYWYTWCIMWYTNIQYDIRLLFICDMFSRFDYSLQTNPNHL